MNPLILIAGLFVLYEVLTHSGAMGSLGSVAPVNTAPVPVIQGGQPVSSPSYQLVAGGGGPSATSTGVGSGVIASLNFIPVVGPAVSAVAGLIFGSLMKASAQRAAEARNENSAVAKEVPAWDNGVQQIVAAYNSGKITANEAVYGLQTPRTGGSGVLWQAYWNVVGPQIQPGRNGCKSGTVQQNPSQSFCSGNAASAGMSYGAACCVGYDNLDVGSSYLVAALRQADANPGRSITSQQVPTVYGSKYGGINRPGYSVTFRKPSAATSLFGF